MPDSGSDDEAKAADLRFTSHERNNVSVDRNLGADGHLARGDKTRMSRINFTARARPADPGERDATFVDREAAGEAGPAGKPEVAPPEPPAPGLLQRLGRLFGQ
jgi:hypothetical protein